MSVYIERVHKGSGTKYKYAEGSMAFPDLASNPSRTILTGEGGSTPSRFKHIIRTKDGGYRGLTPIELERLNGFPDDWTKLDAHGNQVADGKRAFFMGNALVINEFIFDGFMIIILGSFGIASVDKWMNIKNGKKNKDEEGPIEE